MAILSVFSSIFDHSEVTTEIPGSILIFTQTEEILLDCGTLAYRLNRLNGCARTKTEETTESVLILYIQFSYEHCLDARVS